MNRSSVGPFRVLPARVRAAMEYLGYSMSIQHGCGEPRLARDLDRAESRTKHNALACLDQYFTGEQDYADVLYYGHPVPAQAVEQRAELVCMADDEPEEGQVAADDGEDECQS